MRLLGLSLPSKFDPYLAKTKEEAIENVALLRAELQKRRSVKLNLQDFCYPKQHAFVTDQELYSTAVTSRRSGKSTGCAADLLHTAITYPESVSLYITLSRINAKRIFWPILKKINTQLGLGGDPNESDLTMTFGSSLIYLAGAKDASEIENFRGLPIKKVYIDEGQSMKSHIEGLIDDVLEPACIDHDGHIRIIGTPGPVPVGYFHDVSKNPEWSHHFFTVWDNPFIKQEVKERRLQKVLQRRGIDINHPSIQREWFGQWALDLNALVFRYDATKNHYDELPHMDWEYIVSADFGYDDADAIAIMAFSVKHQCAYLVEEKITTKQGITPLANQLNELIDKYKPMKVIGDFGALGKKIAEELQTRFSIPIVAAEKSRKFEFIELTNDSLRTGRFKAKKDSQFAQDSMLLEWDREKQKRNPEKPMISDRFHSDICDAVLYGHRELLHWLWKEEVVPAQPGSIQYQQTQVDEIWQQQRDRLEQQKNEQKMYDTYNDYDYDT